MIIGISGIAGSGKDTCADFLVRNHDFVKVALADPLKRIAHDVFAFTDEQLWGPSEMRNAPDLRYPREHLWSWDTPGPGERPCLCCGTRFKEFKEMPRQCFLTPRHALQQLGTEWGRDCYPNVWIEYALRIAALLARGAHRYTAENGPYWGAGPTSVVVPDLRFRNEIDAFRKAGAKLVRVVRPGAGLTGAAGRHVSEVEQENIPDSAFDVVIVNDGALEELAQKVADLGGWVLG